MKNTWSVFFSITGCFGFVAVTSAFAQNWIQTTNFVGENYSVASSADGTKLVTQAYPNGVNLSTNSGLTWFWVSNSLQFSSFMPLASSADGNKLVAVAANYGSGPVYTSTNAGFTWNLSNVPGGDVVAIASSADGNKLVAAVNSGGPGDPIYTSTNEGTTWKSNSVPIKRWRCVASSADGNILTAFTDLGDVYGSTNAGNNWVLRNTSSNMWWTVATSVDGRKLVAGTDGLVGGPFGGHIYTSTNSGATWVSNAIPYTNAALNYYVASSADGNKLVAVAPGKPIITSTNAGASWITNNVPNKNWTSVASSADGNALVAMGGAVYVSHTTPTPLLKIKPSSSNVVISWLIPSLPFTLQQNQDLTTTNWTDVSTPPVLNLTNLYHEVTLPLTSSNLFYRLKSSP